MSLRILIVDDHEVVRQGVRTILAQRPEWEICGEVANGEEAVQAVSRLRPDLIILDITMPQMSGLEAASRIVALSTDVRILIFTMHESCALIADIRAAGAHGYVQKSQAARDLIFAVDRLLSGGTFFGRELNESSQGDPAPGTPRKPNVSFCSTFCLA